MLGTLLLSLLINQGIRAEASPITIQATEGNVRTLLMGAARMGGLDLVMDDAVGGTVSLSLTAEPEEISDQRESISSPCRAGAAAASMSTLCIMLTPGKSPAWRESP